MGPAVKRIGKKLIYCLSGMTLFLLLAMGLKGMEFRLRVFMAVFAGLSAWMGMITMAVWLWKEGNREEKADRLPRQE
ncbi:MAG: hypothetical protein HY892_09420 [Deltaproteobacteria bacterium]|nr:hypothetical protein [Deltaproteobacteria bacterium]